MSYSVVINEYVELTKPRAQDAHKYVNGVLDRLAQDVRTIELPQIRVGNVDARRI